ncbi:vWA domain-containing protein [Alkalinema pantanalense CENA528]|uniref:vWA domain-containing protein n=1 Tax=Alkalinema pantanalense TaxID=1620705 RepID=UPI003D6FEE24
MKSHYTDINIVLDRSGSMQSIKADTIGGFNAFLEQQKQVPGEATITLAQFDDVYEVVYRAIPLHQAPELNDRTFVPRSSTALLDAIGRTINETGSRLAAMAEVDRPSHVIFVILTDGEENASQQFSALQINQMIRHQSDVYNWEFVFLGANQDAITTASKLGMKADQAITYAASPAGTQAAFKAMSRNMARFREGDGEALAFSEADREEQQNAGL